uniref:Uncharacterized protein n=1 Tax=Arundo donax TaxID=35708 RepID=A0A0A9CFI4_ARUDO
MVSSCCSSTYHKGVGTLVWRLLHPSNKLVIREILRVVCRYCC